ncbi:MAG: cellulase family glycosylhydrolase [Kiritimatiellae bacterium]|nr:cellulase family glycosylhydrolase [Kiritimatiellia bacterium]
MKKFPLFLPVLFATSVAAAGQTLNWTTTKYARIEGDLLIADVPVGEETTGGLATAEIDLSAWDGRSVGAEITASGRGIGKPLHWYNGLKFQFEYEDPVAGDWFYPNTPSRRGDFPAQTIRLGDFGAATRRKARIVLGLQEASGHAEFDLSSLRLVDPVPPWPVTNQNLRCAYSDRIISHRDTEAQSDSAPNNQSTNLCDFVSLCEKDALRGLMSPHRMTKDDFDTLQAWGATLIRYQMWGYRQKKGDPADLDAYDRWLEGKLDHFDTFVLPQAVKRGMKVVLDLHEAPGGKTAFNEMNMLHDPAIAGHFVETWRRIARRFKGREGIYGYDLNNEPLQAGEAAPGCDFWTLQKRAAEAIREIDPETPILIESNLQDSPSAFATLSPLDLTNIIYEVHMYVPLRYTHQGVLWKQGERPDPYPNAEKGWNAETLRGALAPVRDFQRRHGAKIYVGEFSAIAWAPGAEQYLRDCIEIFEDYGWDWTYHAFREWAGWSVEHEGPDASRLVPAADTPRKRALLDGFRR